MEDVAEKILRDVSKDLSPRAAAVLAEHVTPDRLREMTLEAMAVVARQHHEELAAEIRQRILAAIPEYS